MLPANAPCPHDCPSVLPVRVPGRLLLPSNALSPLLQLKISLLGIDHASLPADVFVCKA